MMPVFLQTFMRFQSVQCISQHMDQQSNPDAVVRHAWVMISSQLTTDKLHYRCSYSMFPYLYLFFMLKLWENSKHESKLIWFNFTLADELDLSTQASWDLKGWEDVIK